MKGIVGTACQLIYTFPKISKKAYKTAKFLNLSEKAKIRFKAIELYQKGELSIQQICKVFEIDRSTFYRWRKRYNKRNIQSLEDKSRRPKRLRKPEVTVGKAEVLVCKIRREYPGLGKEKIKVILERDYGIKISASSVGRILTRYKNVLPTLKAGKKRVKKRKRKKIRPKDVKNKALGVISEWIQVDMFEMMLKKIKVYIFVGLDKISRILYMRAYKSKSSKNSADFLRRLNEVHNREIRYIQVDNGSEFEGEFERVLTELGIVKITNYVRSPKMNAYVEKVIDTVQLEYGYKIEEAESPEDVNKVLYECMLYYNFYRPHKSLQYQTPIDFYNENYYNIKNFECCKCIELNQPPGFQRYQKQTGQDFS